MMEDNWYPYEPVIGLEVHVRLGLDSKIFCDDPYLYGQQPNTLISPVSLAYPGTLPKVNKRAIEFAIKMGLACDSEISTEAVFDRKNYFYPDLPKGYQLTQDRNPICKGGRIGIKTKNGIKEIKLTKIHLEEDAGKSIHVHGAEFTQVDFNRAGTALIEMVTDPEIRTPEEAYSLMFEVRRLVRALGISDGNMEHGSMRCDANVSIRKIGTDQLGTKVEIKNVNSFNNVKKALILEIERQVSLVTKGERIISESRTFDLSTGKTHSMRTKESLTDYRYFPDPDLTPVLIDKKWIKTLEQQLPELPMTQEIRYQKEYNLSSNDAAVLTDSQELSEYFEKVVSASGNPKASANWVMGPVKSVLNDQNIQIDEFPISFEKLAMIIKWVDEKKINQNFASKQLFSAALSYPDKPLSSLLDNTVGVSDDPDELQVIINDVIDKFPKEAEMFRKGKKKLIGMFMGQVMKETNGNADPKKVQKILLKAFDNK
jgi:aspartyl-tRNA(Asn)/glutamyl-tRNA(Gln) amidotransferase subunit B